MHQTLGILPVLVTVLIGTAIVFVLGSPLARMVAGRPARMILRSWRKGTLTGLRVASAIAVVVTGWLAFLLCQLVDGQVDAWSRQSQALFVLKLLIAGSYVAIVAWRFLRRHFHNSYYFVLMLVAAGVLTGAALGYRGCVGERVPWFTHLYYGLLLLTGEQPGVWGAPGCETEPVIIQVAQFAGVGVLFFAAIRIVVQLTAHQFSVELAHWSRKVTLVSGLNGDSVPVIRSLVDDPSSGIVAVVEPDPEHPLLPLVRKSGARVIVGEISNRPRDLRWLNKVAKFGRSLSLHQVYLLGADANANVADAEVIRSLLAKLGPDYLRPYLPPTRVIVRIDRYRQARYYAAEQVDDWGAGDVPRVFLATVGTIQATAQALVQRILERKRPEFTVVVGDTDLADAFLDEWRFQQSSAEYLAECLQSSGANDKDSDAFERRMLEFERLKAAVNRPESEDRLPTLAQMQRWSTRYSSTSVVLTGEASDYDLQALEEIAQQLDGTRIRLFVPESGTKGIAEYTQLGCLHFYGLSLGGLSKGDLRRVRDIEQGFERFYADSPLLGVPEDSWLRAAKLISDSYGIAYGPNTWNDQDTENRLSNFRALWHTLTYLGEDHMWVSQCPDGYAQPRREDLGAFVQEEHANWYAFKQHFGWVAIPPNQGPKSSVEDLTEKQIQTEPDELIEQRHKRCLENRMLFTWKQLETQPELASMRDEAAERTTASITNNLRALEALGYYAVRR